jgi:hypothetical protein
MLKNILAKTMLSAAILATATTAQAVVQDIALNGGFESGDFSGWTQFDGGGVQTVNTTNPSSGTYSANLLVPVRTVGAPPVDNVLKNANLEAGNLTAFAPITVTWDMRGELIGDGGVVFIELFSELSGGGVSKAEIFGNAPLFPNDDVNWTSYTWTTTLGPDVSGGVTLQLKSSCGPVVGCGVDASFDNITIMTDLAPVPVPAAAWLFGSALIGLGGVARKRKAA